MLLQSPLGPIVELELLSPEDTVPQGVRIGVKHFLTSPNSHEVASCLQQDGDLHSIVKITEDEGIFQVQRIEDFPAVNNVVCNNKDSKAEFYNVLSRRKEEQTEAFINQNVEPSYQCSLELRLNKYVKYYSFDHNLLCKYNGMYTGWVTLKLALKKEIAIKSI